MSADPEKLIIGDGCGLKLNADPLANIAEFNSGGLPPQTLRRQAVAGVPAEAPIHTDEIADFEEAIVRSNTLKPGLDAGYHWIEKIGAFSVSTVDAMTPPTDDPHTFGSVAALHVLSDLWVSGVEASTMQQYLVLPNRYNKRLLSGILEGFKSICDQFEVKITGGHTRSEGGQYLVGGTATGYAERRYDTKSPRAGDLIVATKHLGTAVTIAAHKLVQDGQGEYLPEDAEETIRSAEESMTSPNHSAVSMRQEGLATACTDITGFGLTGHLSNLLNPVNKGATIECSQLPVIDGADNLLEAGVHTHVGDSAQIEYVTHHRLGDDVLGDPRFHLAFLPETSGGILATVRPSLLDTVQDLVEANGQELAVIGEVTPGKPKDESDNYRLANINLQQ